MNGVWIAHFNAGAAHGSGIAVLRAGEILGGDFLHSWVGNYEEEGPQIYARVRVAPTNSTALQPDGERREKPFMLTLAGSRTQQHAKLSGHADDSVTPVTIEMNKAV